MCHSWFGCFAPSNIEVLEIVFPVTGHSFLPPDRVFGNVERGIKKLEEIIKPEEVVKLI